MIPMLTRVQAPVVHQERERRVTCLLCQRPTADSHRHCMTCRESKPALVLSCGLCPSLHTHPDRVHQ